MTDDNSKPTHCQRLRKLLMSGSTITPLSSWTVLGIYRLASRIHELRSGKFNGVEYQIKDRWKEVSNKYGESCRVKEYFMQPAEIFQARLDEAERKQ